MFATISRRVAACAVAATALALMTACNSATDDPGTSEAQVTVSSVSPTTACVDVDGIPQDVNGDGTNEQVFQSVVQTINLESRVRGSGTSTWSDAVFTQVQVRYEMTNGSAPPTRTEGVAVTVPADGAGSVGMTTVLADDIITFWREGVGSGTATRGTIRLKFTGRDAGGEPVSATGSIPIEAVAVCGS
ncbi:MAG: hypothetical protein U0V87_14625 [Acidobacteriota bacterium]